MSHTIRDKQKLKARTSKIQGQVIALKKMLDEPHECAAVLQQIAAIRGAVNGLMREVITGSRPFETTTYHIKIYCRKIVIPVTYYCK